MKRLYLVAAVMGLWPIAVQAQEGLAPTAPVVPAPMLHNGNVLAPSGGNGWGTTNGPRLLSVAKWSPFRNPATASPVEPTAPTSVYPLPPLPAGVGGSDANCGPTGCGRPARDRSRWDRIKSFLSYHDSPTELPKLRPTPYVTSLQGMFPCTSAPGCASGCANGHNGSVLPMNGQPMPQPQSMPQPLPAPTSTTAGAVMMPPRGMSSNPVQATVQGRVVPESAVTAKPAPGSLVPAGYLRPAPK